MDLHSAMSKTEKRSKGDEGVAMEKGNMGGEGKGKEKTLSFKINK